jgi:hypothetical protein
MSEVKVNKISPRSGTTVTLGDSGDTFTIPSGATINNQGTATNFGATGAASWTTTVKTGDFTAVAGEGYFVDTTSGEVDVTLPAGTAGAVVAIKDYAGTFDTNKVTLVQNGSDKIGGSTNNARLTTEGQAVTLVFIDSTQGWLVTDDGLQSAASTQTFITATGGTITTDGNFKVHTFTGPGTFTVCSIGSTPACNSVDYVVVAGGGAGGSHTGGGGGAGGYRESPGSLTSYTASPLGASPAVALPVSATGFPITVGAGGAAAPNAKGAEGASSVFSTITSAGGGGGSGSYPSTVAAGAGGSGGGGGGQCGGSGGAGNTPPVSPPQGNTGGNSAVNFEAGGGGGATAVGANGTAPNAGAGPGGAGATSSITGSAVTRAGGGGGSTDNPPQGTASGGGGAGVAQPGAGNSGTANTGGGGGGNHNAAPATGGAGGSGIVIIRYKFQL